jgi:hypothetical protein
MYGLALAQLPTQDPYPNPPAAATDINKYNFYIDSVAGLNEQTQNFTAAATNTIAAQSINLTGTTTGVHQLYVKVTDVNGKPSVINVGNFYMEGDNLYQNTPPAATQINQYSFYIDSVTNVNEQVAPFAATNTNTTAPPPISLAGVTSGVHQLYAKVIAADGKPSIINIGNFYMVGDNLYQNTPPAATQINQYSFYIDSVTNVNEQVAPFAATNTNTTAPPPISLAGVTSGVHQLYAKVIAADGKPSIINIGNFYMVGDNLYQNAPPAAVSINRYEFYIDSVTNVNIQPLSFTAGLNNVTPNMNIDLAGVIPGIHYLYARVFDVNNKPSIVNLGSFAMDQIFPYLNVTAAAPALQNMEYYVDTDPGYGLATPITITGTNTTEVLSNISITLPGGLTAGTHIFHIRSKQNPWSIDNVIPFDVLGTVPVNWLFVRAQLLNNESLVSWATAQESNSSKYEIEHSTNNSSFTKVGEVAAAGNTSATTNYSFTHKQLVNGFNYYRLKQIDNDGKYKYSDVVTILKRDNLVQTIIAPNPVKEVLHVVETKETFIGTAEIYNAAGSLVLRKAINNKMQVYSLPVSNLPGGTYVLKIMYKDEAKTYQFIKQ